MPTLSTFYGITIRMHWVDHARPHFHASYSGDEAVFQVDPLLHLSGAFPERAVRHVLEWAKDHREDLLLDWDLLRERRPYFKIEGLR